MANVRNLCSPTDASSERDRVNITTEEWQKFQEAMKNEEFRKYLVEYAEELSDPAKRQVYEQELSLLERERGFDIIWLHPEDGYVLKLFDASGAKCFINICSNSHVADASSEPAVGEDGGRGTRWSFPYCLSPQVVRDCDKRGAMCSVCDVVFHPHTLRLATADARIKRLLEDTAVSALCDNLGVQLERQQRRRYPNIKYKGRRRACVLRKRRSDALTVDRCVDQDVAVASKTTAMRVDNDGVVAGVCTMMRDKLCVDVDSAARSLDTISQPVYSITYREHAQLSDTAAVVPCQAPPPSSSAARREIIVRVQLPAAQSAAQLELEVNERQLQLSGAGYHLRLRLAQPVDETGGGATFDSTARVMTIVLPLLNTAVMTVTEPTNGASHDVVDKCCGAVTRRDSGVASDEEVHDVEKGCGQQNGDTLSDQDTAAHQLADVDFTGSHFQSRVADREKHRSETCHANAPVDCNMVCNDGRSFNATAAEASINDMSAVEMASCSLPAYRLHQDLLHVYITLTQPGLVADSLHVEMLSDCGVLMKIVGMCSGVFYQLLAVFDTRIGRINSVWSPCGHVVVRVLKLTTVDATHACRVGMDAASLVAVPVPILGADESGGAGGIKSILKKNKYRTAATAAALSSSGDSSPDETYSANDDHTRWLLSGTDDCDQQHDADADDGEEDETAAGDSAGAKKMVRFCSHVLEKRYRSDSSIMQDVKRQSRRRAKKRRQRQRCHSDGEPASETDENATMSGELPECVKSKAAVPLNRRCNETAVVASSSDMSDGDSSSGCAAAGSSAQPTTKKRRRNMRNMQRRHKNQLKNRLIFDLDV